MRKKFIDKDIQWLKLKRGLEDMETATLQKRRQRVGKEVALAGDKEKSEM
jgi:hypothetical protein